MAEYFTEYFENKLIKSEYFNNPTLIFLKPIHYNADREHTLNLSLQDSKFY